MNDQSGLLGLYRKASRLPGGNWLFSRMVALKAPYFRSIRPTITALEPGRCGVRMSKRWSVTNHIGTVHAIAMCNMAELSGGLLTEVSIPAGMRWIPKGMNVEYLRKAESDLLAVATPTVAAVAGSAMDYPVAVSVRDSNNVEVFRATINMYLSPKK